MKYASGLTAKIMRKHARARGFYETILLDKWQEIFPSYASFLRPIKLKNGTLTVATNSPSAAHNIKMQGPYLISRINQFVGYGAVKKLQFQVVSFTPEVQEDAPQKLEIKPDAAKKSDSLCKNVADDALRDCLTRLGGYILSEQKKEK